MNQRFRFSTPHNIHTASTEVTYLDNAVSVTIHSNGNKKKIFVLPNFVATSVSGNGGTLAFSDGRRLRYLKVGEKIYIHFEAQTYTVELAPRDMNESSEKMDAIKSPMPGKLLKLYVSEGQSVKKGDPILIMEAMKMENTILATHDATVEKVFYKEGDTIPTESVLIELS